jgi:hypothetical protein
MSTSPDFHSVAFCQGIGHGIEKQFDTFGGFGLRKVLALFEGLDELEFVHGLSLRESFDQFLMGPHGAPLPL